MSANNQLVIIEREGVFYIYMNYCVDNPFPSNPKGEPLKREYDLREAIKWAKDYCGLNLVEYGYTIQLEEKKTNPCKYCGKPTHPYYRDSKVCDECKSKLAKKAVKVRLKRRSQSPKEENK